MKQLHMKTADVVSVMFVLLLIALLFYLNYTLPSVL